MIKFIQTDTPEIGIQELSTRLIAELKSGKKVAWLLAGGSNLPIAVEVMKRVRALCNPAELANLTLGPTDERYGPVGHKDSNWKQLADLGFDFNCINHFAILNGTSLQETAKTFGDNIKKIFAENDIVIAQAGLGADGHIAGTLPHTPAVHAKEIGYGYEWKPFTRVTMSMDQYKQIDVVYVFASGESKRGPISDLQHKDLSLDDAPCQILKVMKEVYVYSDVVRS